jgi:hypothetical protein
VILDHIYDALIAEFASVNEKVCRWQSPAAAVRRRNCVARQHYDAQRAALGRRATEAVSQIE